LSVGNITAKWNITIKDTTFPVINITYPTNTSYNISIDNLNYTYSDTNEGFCWYSTNDGATNSTSISAGTNWDGLDSGGGSFTWIVYCNDSSGNINSSSVTFLSTRPIINVTWVSPTTDVNVSQNQFFEVQARVSCLNSNCGEINVTLDPATVLINESFESDMGEWIDGGYRRNAEAGHTGSYCIKGTSSPYAATYNFSGENIESMANISVNYWVKNSASECEGFNVDWYNGSSWENVVHH